MSLATSASAPAALTQLADQWTVLRERYAFLLEVLLRLVTDHPDLASDVIQGAVQTVHDANDKATAFSEALQTLREQTQVIDRSQEDS